MISISTLTYDLLGSVLINTRLDTRDNRARVTRTKTLDGGVYINHLGVSDGDMTVKVSTRISVIQSSRLWNIFNNYSQIYLGTPEGIFLAVIQALKIDNGNMTMTILIEQKESA